MAKKSFSLLGHVCVLGYCYLFALLNCLFPSTHKKNLFFSYKIPDFCSLVLRVGNAKNFISRQQKPNFIANSFMSNLKQNVSNLFFVLPSMFVSKQLRSFDFLYHNLNCDMKQSHKMSNFHRSSDSLIAKCFLLCEKFSEIFKRYECR